MSKNFLLVHGAWQGAWVWNKIQPKLTAEGHTVKAIDLPGSGDDQTSVAAVSLDVYARKIIDAASLLSAQGKVTLVGHSMGARLSRSLRRLHQSCLKNSFMSAPSSRKTASL